MRSFVCLAAALAVAAGAARADEKDNPKDVIERAVKAAGGEENLAKHKAETFKGKGKFYGGGEGVDYTGEWNVQRPDKMKVEITTEAGGMKFTFVRVVNGDKVWLKLGDNVEEVDDKDRLAEAREESYANNLTTLLPLVKDKGYELKALGEFQLEGKPALGVKVSSKGHRDVSLYFDKDTGLLVRTETTVKDPMGGDKEILQETTYGDFKEVDGVKHAMKVVIQRDGKKFVEAEVTDFQHRDKIDDAVFGKP